MGYPNYPVTDHTSPLWRFTDKQLFLRDGHIQRPLEYVDAFNTTKHQWLWFDPSKTRTVFGGWTGLDLANKIRWIVPGGFFPGLSSGPGGGSDPSWTSIVAPLPPGFIAKGTISNEDYRSVFVAHQKSRRNPTTGNYSTPGGWDSNGRWDYSVDPLKSMAAVTTTVPTLNDIKNLLLVQQASIDSANQAAIAAANAAKAAADAAASTQTTVTGGGGGGGLGGMSQTTLLLIGAGILAFFMFKK